MENFSPRTKDAETLIGMENKREPLLIINDRKGYGKTRCEACDIYIGSNLVDDHNTTEEHLSNAKKKNMLYVTNAFYHSMGHDAFMAYMYSRIDPTKPGKLIISEK